MESARYALRIDHLRDVGATVRFVSAEPLLGSLPDLGLAGIDWLIAGDESGLGARPMDEEWVREFRDQCGAGGVRFFSKQWGDRPPRPTAAILTGSSTTRCHSATSPAVCEITVTSTWHPFRTQPLTARGTERT